MSSAALLARRLHGSSAAATAAKPARATPAARAALPGYLQARLHLSQPGDALEQEAERAAAAVARGEAPDVKPAATATLARSAAGDGALSPAIEQRIEALRQPPAIVGIEQPLQPLQLLLLGGGDSRFGQQKMMGVEPLVDLAEPLRHHLGDAALQPGRHLLGQPGEIEVVALDDAAIVGWNQPRHQLHQCRFSSTVAPDQRNALAVLDVEVDSVDQRRMADRQLDIAQLQQEFGHAGSVGLLG